ncbi:hypothetical protein [uncultured Sphingomonas sp.]|uniref:hypothetical protein n=1 Tax=uncultured Sphingomonas sp. TaxID=158754 RepID=UPI0025FDB1C1|nr:hypothetical protein [uncultured Sphingomonas sp.]
MIATALTALALAASSPGCAGPAPASVDRPDGTRGQYAFQNGGPVPLRLRWIDRAGRAVDQGIVEPGGFMALDTYPGHLFELVDPAGRCRRRVRIDGVLNGTYVGTSRYRRVPAPPGWKVFVDLALRPKREPARTALATIARMLNEVDAVLPAAALAQVRGTPIFLLDHSGPGGMYHPDPGWLVAHGRTTEMTRGIEVSDAAVFVDAARVQPGYILHELAHAYFFRLPDADRAVIEATYRDAMASGRYLAVKRHDGSTVDAYARTNAAEYFAELTEAYFSRNDFFPFTRADLSAHDPEGERLIARMWR